MGEDLPAINNKGTVTRYLRSEKLFRVKLCTPPVQPEKYVKRPIEQLQEYTLNNVIGATVACTVSDNAGGRRRLLNHECLGVVHSIENGKLRVRLLNGCYKVLD